MDEPEFIRIIPYYDMKKVTEHFWRAVLFDNADFKLSMEGTFDIRNAVSKGYVEPQMHYDRWLMYMLEGDSGELDGKHAVDAKNGISLMKSRVRHKGVASGVWMSFIPNGYDLVDSEIHSGATRLIYEGERKSMIIHAGVFPENTPVTEQFSNLEFLAMPTGGRDCVFYRPKHGAIPIGDNIAGRYFAMEFK